MIFKETEKLELKSEINENFEKEIVAFLNTFGGVIYIGVENCGKITGVNNVDKEMKKIADMLKNNILPKPQKYVEVMARYINEKIIIEVSIKKGNALYYVRKYGRSVKGCYIRIGSTTRGMSEEQIEERWITSLEQKDYLTTITTNWKDITFNQLNIYYYGSGFHLSFETLVENLNLITEDKKYNKLAELLSDKNHIGFIFARFKGKDKSSMSETIDFGNQCIITAVEKIINRLEAENTGVSIITSTKRLDKKLVDIECLKEAIYNAVINNDWINNRVPIIYRFSDRIEILSYGGLPPWTNKR